MTDTTMTQQTEESASKKGEFDHNPSAAKPIEVTEELKKALLNAKIDLTLKYPFMGFLVMSCNYYYTNDLPTMAATTIPTSTVFINPDFMMNILKNRKERAFVLAHEILHIFLDHIGRQRELTYHPMLWNIAADYCINSYLKHMDTAEKTLAMPDFGLYDVKYKDMSSDAIYHDILEEAKNSLEKALEEFGEPGDGEEDGEEGGQGGEGSGEGKGKKPRPFDHISQEEVGAATKAENKQKISAAVGQASADDRQAGSGSAGLLRLFENMIEPVIPWKNLLQDFVTETSRNRYTYNRISRRSNTVCFPTMTGDHIKLAFGVDTSGSMSAADLGEAMTELASIMDTYESWDMDLMSCDTKAHIIDSFNSEDGDDFTSVNKELVGGGGTDMAPMVDMANEMDDEPACIVIVTDGYIPEQSVETAIDGIPVLMIVTRAGNKDLNVEGAQVIHINDE